MTKSKEQMNPLKINFETSVSHEKLLTKFFREHVLNININMLAACISSIHSVSFTVGVSQVVSLNYAPAFSSQSNVSPQSNITEKVDRKLTNIHLEKHFAIFQLRMGKHFALRNRFRYICHCKKAKKNLPPRIDWLVFIRKPHISCTKTAIHDFD